MQGLAGPEEGASLLNGLYVAAHGSELDCGLYLFQPFEGRWKGELLAAVEELTALAWHPSLQVVYGVSGSGAGLAHAWKVSGEGTSVLSELPTNGLEPCHVAVSPDGRLLVVSNYESGTLSSWWLAPDGSLSGSAQLVELSGSSVDSERQRSSHPHQVTFAEGLVYVVDLGADMVRVFEESELASPHALTPLREVATPAGTGPRHMAMLPFGEVALSGELSDVVLRGRLDLPACDWQQSHCGEVSALPTDARNYPGDIQSSTDGRFVYVAIRGRGTVASFAIGAGQPQLVGERESSVLWPQHLLVTGEELLVAGRDLSRVVELPLTGGLPGPSRTLFECPGPSWLLLARETSRS